VDSAVTALLATGRPTGIVVDCGYDSSHVATVYEGYSTYSPSYNTS
jgi:actin-related protein